DAVSSGWVGRGRGAVTPFTAELESPMANWGLRVEVGGSEHGCRASQPAGHTGGKGHHSRNRRKLPGRNQFGRRKLPRGSLSVAWSVVEHRGRRSLSPIPDKQSQE